MGYDPRFIDDVRRAAGMKPATVKEHDQAAADAYRREAAQRRRAKRTSAPLACAAGRPAEQVAQKVRDGIRQAVGSAAGPFGEALQAVTVETDPEVKTLWPGARSYLIRAGRRLVEQNPKISRPAVLGYYRNVLPKIFKALDLDGLDLEKEAGELTDLAMTVAQVAGKQPVSASRPKADPLKITWPSTPPVAASRGVALFTSYSH